MQNWQLEQGLPQISVTSIAQTPDGYLWVGTFNGLARFDGVRFTVFHDGNAPALGNSGILALEVDEQGALWILTIEGGLVRMANGEFAVVARDEAALGNGGVFFVRDPSHRLFLHDPANGVRRIDHGRLVALEAQDPLLTDPEPALLMDSSGVSIAVLHGKVTRALGAESRVKPVVSVQTSDGPANGVLDLAIDCAAQSRHGGCWLATDTDIHRVEKRRAVARLAPLPGPVKRVFLMKEDRQGNVWVAPWGGGLICGGPERTWQPFDARAGLADNHITCLFLDREGSLWVGTGQGGLHRIRPRVFQIYDTPGTSANVVMSVTQDGAGRMWFAVNGGGLHTLTGDGLVPVSDPALGRSSLLTYSVLADREQAIWAGLYGRVALRWHEGAITWHRFDEEPKLMMTPRTLFEDRAGTIWAGCTHGLMRFHNGRFTRYSTKEGLSCDTIAALAEDRSGTLYVGTDGGGLNCLRHDRFIALTERDGLADDHVSSLYVDKEQTLWIGTANGGLSRYKHGRFATVRAVHGLPSNTIGTVLEDDKDHLWLGSNRGIIRVNRRALNEYLDGQGGPVAWRLFGLSDGLSTVGCGGGGQPGSWKAKDGRLWFATVKGAAVVDPNLLQLNSQAPPVVIEEVLLDDLDAGNEPDNGQAWKAAAIGRKPKLSRAPSPIGIQASLVTVPPSVHRVELRFTGLSFVASEKVKFRHRLEPLDNEWVEDGALRFAYYTKIPAGRYLFRVAACNSDGIWNTTGASVGLLVLPPWWSTWWFRLVAALAAGGTIFGWYELRLRRARREQALHEGFARQLLSSQENERRRIAGELHDGLGQNLVVIRNRAELGLRQFQAAPAVAEQLRQISAAAAQSLDEVRTTAHALRPYELERLGLTKAIQDAAQKAAETSRVKFACELDNIDGLLAPDNEIGLFRIIQEGISNVLRHAHASEVIIEMKRDGGGVRLTVLDDGCGFSMPDVEARPPANAGFGLTNIAARAKMLGGQSRIESAAGKGTSLTVWIPLPTGQL